MQSYVFEMSSYLIRLQSKLRHTKKVDLLSYFWFSLSTKPFFKASKEHRKERVIMD
jgi:hypothetical protein